jgi:hypothetical protein
MISEEFGSAYLKYKFEKDSDYRDVQLNVTEQRDVG